MIIKLLFRIFVYEMMILFAAAYDDIDDNIDSNNGRNYDIKRAHLMDGLILIIHQTKHPALNRCLFYLRETQQLKQHLRQILCGYVRYA
jgi:hypothetical protein